MITIHVTMWERLKLGSENYFLSEMEGHPHLFLFYIPPPLFSPPPSSHMWTVSVASTTENHTWWISNLNLKSNKKRTLDHSTGTNCVKETFFKIIRPDLSARPIIKLNTKSCMKKQNFCICDSVRERGRIGRKCGQKDDGTTGV